MPEVIPPDGLSYKRKQYLFNEIREFCTAETRDLVRPKPPEELTGKTIVGVCHATWLENRGATTDLVVLLY